MSLQSSHRIEDHTDKPCDDEKKVEFLWADLTQLQSLTPLDFIIMNPPFHQNKESDVAIGKAFIETAHASLKPSGRLFIVANAHLPYEQILCGAFSDVEKLHEGQGFKVFVSVK